MKTYDLLDCYILLPSEAVMQLQDAQRRGTIRDVPPLQEDYTSVP